MQNTVNRRRFLSLAALGAAATQFAGLKALHAAPAIAPKQNSHFISRKLSSFSDIKQVKTSLLDIGYAEAGPANGPVIILLHGWPYDIHSYAEVAPLLAAHGFRVLIPHLRGHGTTRFLSPETPRNGQQSAIAADIIEFMDALKIRSAVIGGFDWGARTANIIAALWPERCKTLISVSGYLIGSQQANQKPLSPKAELSWWYQYYFSTERGYNGYKENRNEFAKLIWQTASPKWNFDEATFNRSAASLENPDHVDIVINNYRWRVGLTKGESKYDAYEQTLAGFPDIQVPTVTIEGDANGAPHPKPEDYARRFKGKYKHITLAGGVGHNPPQEAPDEFAAAVLEAISMTKE
ncbi:MAG: alpha/beta hydrolase [Chitinophagaceae bacterium]|nr:alpha/beta hydrolase [Chitinophagaceae bacterium]